jgi:ABC-2 type transport system ATP-binding protein
MRAAGPEAAPVDGGAASEPAILAFGLAKSYGRVQALSDLTMSVPRGEIFGFLGPNGAGKTTAVKLLLGLTFPTAGEGLVLGSPIGDREARRSIGYLPELFRYQDWLSGREVLEFHCVLAGLPRRAHRAEADRVLEIVGLAARGRDRVATYSKGMQQRLGLAVALVGSPALIFLDEPTSALDPVGRLDVREILRQLKRAGVSVFLNSHLLTEVEHVCDRIAVVDRGRVIAIGPLSELMAEGFSVRIRVEAAAPQHLEALRRVCSADPDEGGYLLREIDPDSVPDAVAALVSAGARIRSVEPKKSSLEDHFMRLLKGAGDSSARDR